MVDSGSDTPKAGPLSHDPLVPPPLQFYVEDAGGRLQGQGRRSLRPVPEISLSEGAYPESRDSYSDRECLGGLRKCMPSASRYVPLSPVPRGSLPVPKEEGSPEKEVPYPSSLEPLLGLHPVHVLLQQLLILPGLLLVVPGLE